MPRELSVLQREGTEGQDACSTETDMVLGHDCPQGPPFLPPRLLMAILIAIVAVVAIREEVNTLYPFLVLLMAALGLQETTEHKAALEAGSNRELEVKITLRF